LTIACSEESEEGEIKEGRVKVRVIGLGLGEG